MSRRSTERTKKEFKLYESTIPQKKWDVYVPYIQHFSGGVKHRLKKVSYGAKGMSDYTIHHDVDRRSRYRDRHANDHIDDPYKPGFWSMWHLWGRSSDSKKAFQQAVKKAKRLI
jgi:hypothetical protein